MIKNLDEIQEKALAGICALWEDPLISFTYKVAGTNLILKSLINQASRK